MMGLAEKLVPHFMGQSSTQLTEMYIHAVDKELSKRANSKDFAIA